MSVGNAAIVGVAAYLTAAYLWDTARRRTPDWDPAIDRLRAALAPAEPRRTGFWTPTKGRQR